MFICCFLMLPAVFKANSGDFYCSEYYTLPCLTPISKNTLSIVKTLFGFSLILLILLLLTFVNMSKNKRFLLLNVRK